MNTAELHISDHTLTVTERSSFLVLRPGSKVKENFGDSLSDSDEIDSKDVEAGNNKNNTTTTGSANEKEVNVKGGSPSPTGWRRFLGFIFTVIHIFAFSGQALIVKLLPDYHPFSLAVWRFQGIGNWNLD
jgi:hypothetical protein